MSSPQSSKKSSPQSSLQSSVQSSPQWSLSKSVSDLVVSVDLVDSVDLDLEVMEVMDSEVSVTPQLPSINNTMSQSSPQ